MLRHRVTIQRGHNRRRIAGNIQQDGGDAPAIFTANVDRSQQDQRGFCGQMQSKGQRQQDRHAVGAAQAGQHAHDDAQQDADEHQAHVVPRKHDAEAVHQCAKVFHLLSPLFLLFSREALRLRWLVVLGRQYRP
ncbi:hypothetical protein SDC9_83698 [bioreactor metagenome]|uniref:Uncharacterized protein n=1 Tax=bioreactor metagenome TaxID=1076179 RepID=A0A644Z8F0_9ZZZZ